MSAPENKSLGKGAIAWMAQNTVAANLLMAVILIAGAIGLFRIKQEVFPEFSLDVITASVVYPGASPSEVEQGIVLAIEEEVRALDGVKRVTSTSAEGAGAVAIELQLDANAEKALADVKSAVDRIRSFPEDAEEPQVQLAVRRNEVVSLIIHGDQDLATLHQSAERARELLLAKEDITQVELVGVPALEVSIDVSRTELKAYGLTLDDVARQVTAASLELPGGSVETRSGEILVRVADRKRAGHEFADIPLLAASGATLRLGDIATVTDGYEDADLEASYNGERAVRVVAYRSGDESPQQVSDAVKDAMVDLRGELPAALGLATWGDESEMLRGRIDLLVRNARTGLILVLIILALFLDLRLAFWVGLGIPISFMGGLLLMPFWDISINMITLFAFIVTLGMVVDDAIVVGENAFAKREAGLPPMQAAIEGAREMAVPITFAILTTIAAFSPLFFVPGFMGKIFKLLPAVVCFVLFISLIESFFILPAHLGHERSTGLLASIGQVLTRILRPLTWARGYTTRALRWLIEDVFEPFLRRMLEYRAIVLAVSAALFITSVGVVASGTVPFSFFPKLEGEEVTATVRLPYGVPLERTEEVQAILEASAQRTIDQMPEGTVRGRFSKVGEGPRISGPGGGIARGSHLATVQVRLVPTDGRDYSSLEFAQAWSENTPPIAATEALTFSSSTGPGAGAAVDLQLSHSNVDTLAAISQEVAEILRGYPDLTDVENDYASGKVQLDFQLNDHARTLGLTSLSVGRQLRAGFYGAEALREQRGRNEIKVMVRYPESERASEWDLSATEVRTPTGAWVPLASVATVDRGRAPTSIIREEGRRIVNVKAELAKGIASNQEVMASLKDDVVPELLAKYPGLSVDFAGAQREQAESLSSLGGNYLFAMFAIYGLLAIPFKSYTQPLIVMSAIPMGFVGAVFGHVVMDYGLSIISMFGIVALSGVVVNDSLVLLDATNRARANRATALEAIVFGATRRFRPILLTSLTTFFGLLPMIFETSVQARFLIPMAISLGYGVLFATFVILLLVPALYMVLDDILGFVRWAYADDEDDETAAEAGLAAR